MSSPVQTERCRRAVRRQRGLTMLELLVGVAVGLIVVLGAVKLAIDAFGSNRRMLLETRVNQDLRAAADLIARDIRRAGYWQNAASGIFTTTGSGTVISNPYTGIALDTSNANAHVIEYRYARDATNTVETAEEAGFRLSNGVLEFLNGDGGWQALTDPRVVTITNLSVTAVPARVVDLYTYCACMTKLTCTAAQFQDSTLSTNYVSSRPTVTIRQYDMVLAGRSATDAAVQREIRETVRVRNDVMSGSCPPV